MGECKESAAETVELHATSGIGIPLDYSMGYKFVEKIIYEAENIKLKVAIENIRMLNYLEFILEEFKSDYAGIFYDSSHDFSDGQSCENILEKLKENTFFIGIY